MRILAQTKIQRIKRKQTINTPAYTLSGNLGCHLGNNAKIEKFSRERLAFSLLRNVFGLWCVFLSFWSLFFIPHLSRVPQGPRAVLHPHHSPPPPPLMTSSSEPTSLATLFHQIQSTKVYSLFFGGANKLSLLSQVCFYSFMLQNVISLIFV